MTNDIVVSDRANEKPVAFPVGSNILRPLPDHPVAVVSMTACPLPATIIVDGYLSLKPVLNGTGSFVVRESG